VTRHGFSGTGPRGTRKLNLLASENAVADLSRPSLTPAQVRDVSIRSNPLSEDGCEKAKRVLTAETGPGSAPSVR